MAGREGRREELRPSRFETTRLNQAQLSQLLPLVLIRRRRPRRSSHSLKERVSRQRNESPSQSLSLFISKVNKSRLNSLTACPSEYSTRGGTATSAGLPLTRQPTVSHPHRTTPVCAQFLTLSHSLQARPRRGCVTIARCVTVSNECQPERRADGVCGRVGPRPRVKRLPQPPND